MYKSNQKKLLVFILSCVIIFSLFTYTNCEMNVIDLPITVNRVPPENIEFQFQKNATIDPISLREGNIKFHFFESDTTKNFRDPKPIKQNINYNITATVEYRYNNSEEIHERTFQYEFQHNSHEVIIVRFPIRKNQPLLPQTETCTSQNCLQSGFALSEYSLTDEIDAARKPIKEPHPAIYIDEETLEESCESDYGYTEELLNTALQHGNIGTKLILKGLENTDTLVNPVDAIRDIIFQRLDLPHLEYNILQAKYIDEGLLFEMQTSKDVIEILSQAHNKLEKSNDKLKFELSTDSFFTERFDIDVRISDLSQ